MPSGSELSTISPSSKSRFFPATMHWKSGLGGSSFVGATSKLKPAGRRNSRRIHHSSTVVASAVARGYRCSGNLFFRVCGCWSKLEMSLIVRAGFS